METKSILSKGRRLNKVSKDKGQCIEYKGNYVKSEQAGESPSACIIQNLNNRQFFLCKYVNSVQHLPPTLLRDYPYLPPISIL